MRTSINNTIGAGLCVNNVAHDDDAHMYIPLGIKVAMCKMYDDGTVGHHIARHATEITRLEMMGYKRTAEKVQPKPTPTQSMVLGDPTADYFFGLMVAHENMIVRA